MGTRRKQSVGEQLCVINVAKEVGLIYSGFWNYFQYGLDFLISPDGLVEKVICHSNIVCQIFGYKADPRAYKSARYTTLPAIRPLSVDLASFQRARPATTRFLVSSILLQ